MPTKSNKRRLSSGTFLKENNKENEILDSMLEENDDEAEKRERRKSRLLDPREILDAEALDDDHSEEKQISLSNMKRKSIGGVGLSLAPSNNKLKNSGRLPSKKGKQLTNSELSDIYSNCIKLSTENKINQKNAWDLNLIDYIDDVVEVQQTSNGDVQLTNFQVASVTLDASVKIYSTRVDSVHTDTFKVLGGLSRTERTSEAHDEEDEDGKAEDDENREGGLGGEGGDGIDGKDKLNDNESGAQSSKPQKKFKKLQVGGINTIETNADNISVKSFDLSFDVDPLFKKTSAAFDEGGARGLLLNHLSVYNNCELIFDSSDAINYHDKEKDDNSSSSQVVDISELKRKLETLTSNINQLDICPTYSNFRFNPDDDDEDDDNAPADYNVEKFSDDEIPDAPELNFDFGGGVNNNFDDDQFVQQQEANLMKEISAVDDIEDGLVINGGDQRDTIVNGTSRIIREYDNDNNNITSIINPSVLQNWAGPNHWKFRKNQQQQQQSGMAGDDLSPNNVEAIESNSKKSKKARKEAFYFDFRKPSEIDISKAFALPSRGPGSTVLTSQALKKSSNNLLPPDIHYDSKMLSQLFTKPKWRVSQSNRRKRDKSKVESHSANDSSAVGNGGIEFNNHDDDDDDNGGGFMIPHPDDINGFGGDLTGDTGANGIGELQLVAEPRKVEQIKINYAKTAKFVDVKALKESIWKEIKEEPKEEQTFTDILNNIPNRVSKESIDNISVPFCFICLLHIANEKGLNISNEHMLIDKSNSNSSSSSISNNTSISLSELIISKV